MKRKTIILLLICFLLAIPNIIDRMKKEAEPNLQLIISLDEVKQVAIAENLPLENVFITLKELGVQSLSIAPITLKTLSREGEILMYDQRMLAKIRENPALIKGQKGTYFSAPPTTMNDKRIQTALPVLPIFLDSKKYYYLPLSSEEAEDIPLGYDNEAIDNLTAHDLNYHFILPTEAHFDLQRFTRFIHAQQHPGLVAFLFSGNIIPGYPNPIQITKLAETFQTKQISWLFPELQNIAGSSVFAEAIDYQLYRIHALNLAEMNLQTAVNRAVRAVKERKINAIYLHLPTNQEEPFLATTNFIEQFKQKLKRDFSPKFTAPLSSSPPLLFTVLALLASFLFIFFLSRGYPSVAHYLWVLLSLILAGGYLLSAKIIWLQLLLFMLVILTPIYSFLFIRKTPKQSITKVYLQTLLIHFIGIACIISLSNDIRLLVGVEVFRFVKLAYLLPLGVIASYYFRPFIKTKFWRQAITYQQVGLLFVLFIFGYFYLTRTGNSGFTLPGELSLRQLLEDILYVRPRTKEFLLGFPAFLFAIYLLKNDKQKSGFFLLLIGAIGFTSLLNTFLHFHIPVYISLLRSVYSIVFGYLIGWMIICLFEKYVHFSRRRKIR